MKSVCFKAGLAALLMGVAGSANASDFSVGAQVTAASSFTDEDLSVYTRGPTIQNGFTLDHVSGLFLETWSNLGLNDSSGDELDLMAGYESEIAKDLTVTAWVGYYLFRGGESQVSFASILAYKGASIRGEYYIPISGETEGFRIVGAYTEEWEKFSLTASVTHDTGAYDVSAITVAGLKAEYEVAKNVSFAISGQLPIIKNDHDNRGAQVTASAIIRF